MFRSLIVLPDSSEIFSGVGTVTAIISATLTEYTNREAELTLGSVCASSLELKIFALGGKLNIAEGSEITYFRVDDSGNKEKVGIFITEKPTKASANTYKVTAYDRVSKLDKDLTEWLQGLALWPYSLYDFASKVCSACGLELKNTSIPNGDYQVQRFNASNITGRQLMQKIGEICCRFGRATPDGKFEFAWYEDKGKVITVSDYFQGGLTYEDYSVSPIERVRIQQGDGSSDVTLPNNPDARNTYIISGNYLLTADDTTSLWNVAMRIYEELQGVTYTPCKCVLQAAKGVKSGEIVQITDLNGATIKAMVMSRRQSGQKDTIECYGSYSRDSVTCVNNNPIIDRLFGEIKTMEGSLESVKESNKGLDSRLTAINQEIPNSFQTALQNYVKNEEFASYKESSAAQLEVAAGQITTAASQAATKDIEAKNEILQKQIDEIKTNYRFTADGQYIGKTDSDTMMRLINDMMQILVSGVAATTVDRYGLHAEQANIKTLHMGDYTLSLGNDGHLTLS